MSKKFSELPPKESLDSADYIPIVDSADSNPETQNKIVTFQTVRDYFTEDLDEFLEQAQTAESARVTAENARRSSETTRNNNESTRQSNETTREANETTRQTNETARENAETGYIQQAKSWAVGTNGVARAGDATDNAKYYAEQAQAYHDAISEIPVIESNIEQLLHYEEIDDTVQTIIFDESGNVSAITHTKNGSAIRTDTFVFGESAITETRTLSTGESLTIITNLETLSTTITYAA